MDTKEQHERDRDWVTSVWRAKGRQVPDPFDENWDRVRGWNGNWWRYNPRTKTMELDS
jgi:hypothetical protein